MAGSNPNIFAFSATAKEMDIKSSDDGLGFIVVSERNKGPRLVIRILVAAIRLNPSSFSTKSKIGRIT